VATNSSRNTTESMLQPLLFEALPEHLAPNRTRRKSSSTQPIAALAAPQEAPSKQKAPHQFRLPFPKAREAAGKFVRDALHEGMKDAAKKVVVTAIFASGAAAVGHVQFDAFGLKAKRELPKVITPWETTVKPAQRIPVIRP
jgi:hypothetical protein